MAILVTGGAGYIGSVTTELLRARGEQVVVLDNLSRGHRAAVAPEVPFYEGNVGDRELVTRIVREHEVEACVHFAAFAYVGESVKEPGKYYRNNLVNTLHLFDAMRRHGVGKVVFSSTCATYGVPERVPITEDTPQRPINPYGNTKLAVEMALADYAAAHQWGFAALRYFNAAGASPDGSIGEDHDPETHLIPLVLQVPLGRRETITIFGDDYPTRDGTCVRDYVHILDLAQAHILALAQCDRGGGVFNLGNGAGFTNREVVETARRVTGHPIPAEYGPRRPGDPAELVASSERARTLLGWRPRFPDLESIVASAWRWHSTHPRGYGDG